jgi:hypothetical protein
MSHYIESCQKMLDKAKFKTFFSTADHFQVDSLERWLFVEFDERFEQA